MTRFTRRQRLRSFPGQGLAEYALILALIAIVAVIALIFLGAGSRYAGVPEGALVVWTGHHAGFESRVVATDEGGIFCSIQQDFHPATESWVSGERICNPPPPSGE